MVLTFLTKYRESGLLVLRVALGAIFFFAHGWPLLAGGIVKWRELGHAMHFLHINFAPVFWGFMAAFSESIGVLLLILGLFFRPSCILLALTMLVASIMDLKTGGLAHASHALELFVLFSALILIGPGKYSVDKS
jgi:putative oxidoreductase